MTTLADAIQARDLIMREALEVYRPATPYQLDVHTKNTLQTLVKGGNRSAKSLTTFMEFASRVTGRRVKGHHSRDAVAEIMKAANDRADYEPLRKYLCGEGVVDLPSQFRIPGKEVPSLYWVVGWDFLHVGQTIYRLLFEPGAFQVIRDQDTDQWRVFNPADPRDSAREYEAVAAEPMIPERLIDMDSWDWEPGMRKQNVFRSVKLKNGAVIKSFSSSQKKGKMGDPVDGILIDEDVQGQEYVDELERRLLDKKGWMLWGVWPQRTIFALVKLMNRVKDRDPYISAIQLKTSDNPFFDRDTKDRSTAMAGSPEQVARRDHGDMLLDEIAMYQVRDEKHGIGDEFGNTTDRDMLKLQYRLDRNNEDRITRQKVLTAIWNERAEFPAVWTRYLSIDPSNTRTACIFGVVPPPELYGVDMSRTCIVEDELVVKQHSAGQLAAELQKIMGGRSYEAFIMDKRCGRQTQTGRDDSTFDTYTKSFSAAGIRCRLTDSSFIPGVDVPTFRFRAVRIALEGDGKGPFLFYVRFRTPETQREFMNYRKKQVRNSDGELQVNDEPENPRRYDCMAGVEYLEAYLESMFDMGKAYVQPTVHVASTAKPPILKAAKVVSQLMQAQSTVSYH